MKYLQLNYNSAKRFEEQRNDGSLDHAVVNFYAVFFTTRAALVKAGFGTSMEFLQQT